MIKDGTNKAAIPKKSLWGKVIDANRIAELDIRNGLVKGEIGREKGDQDIASGPVLDIFRQINSCFGLAAIRCAPSSRITLSPKTLTSIAPRALSTNLVRISLMGLDLALTSMAHIPKIIGGLAFSVTAA